MSITPGLRQAVITGAGVVSTHGAGMDSLWAALAQGIGAGRSWAPDDDGDVYNAAPLPDDYRAHADIPRNVSYFLDRGSLIALDAALQALAAAGLEAGSGDARRFAIADGMAYRAPGQATLFVPYGQVVARALGVRGSVVTTAGSTAAGMRAIAEGARMVALGRADVVVAGAAQSLQRPILEHSTSEKMSSGGRARPFDAGADGMVPAEGAAWVVIEAEEQARERGAEAVARVAGIGETFDPSVEPLAVSEGAEAGRTMQAALADAGFMQNQVDLVVSCADGRPGVDMAEGLGLKRTFGRHAHFAGVTTVGATAGHAFAASGPLSVAVALEAMAKQAAPGMAGPAEQAEGLELAFVRETRPERVDCVLVTSLGMGGDNVSLLLERVGNR